jgi:hypothetical protein
MRNIVLNDQVPVFLLVHIAPVVIHPVSPAQLRVAGGCV